MRPSRATLRAGLVVDVEVGETLTLRPSLTTRTIIVHLLEKSGRRAKLRVQSNDAVHVSTETAEKEPAIG